MIEKSIENCLQKAKEKGWDKTFWAFDLHGTIMKPNFRRDVISTEFYPEAKETMQLISKRKDIVRILFTCSYPHEIKEYIELFNKNNIYFDYVNQNPEIPDGNYGHYKEKFYFNVLFDDKAGFDGNADWPSIKKIISEI